MTGVPEIVFDQWPDDQMTTWPNILSMKKCDLRKIGNQRGKGEMVSERGFLSNVWVKMCLGHAEKVDRNAKTYLGGNAGYGRNLYIRVVHNSSWA